jgi:hypothetical protein
MIDIPSFDFYSALMPGAFQTAEGGRAGAEGTQGFPARHTAGDCMHCPSV